MSTAPTMRVHLDLSAALDAMLRQQAASIGMRLEECPPEAVQETRQQLIGALIAGMQPLTDAIVDQMEASGWLHVDTATDLQLQAAGLKRTPAPTASTR